MATQPGSLTLAQELTEIHARLDELSRTKPVYPVCEATLNAEVPGLSGIILAYGNWSALTDPHGMFTPGGPGLSLMRVPVTGRYVVFYRATFFATTSNVESRVYRNGTAPEHLIVVYGRGGSSGAMVSANAYREMRLVEGDALYWGNFLSTATTLEGDPAGFNTTMLLRYVGTG